MLPHAVVFDMDGVIADTERVSLASFASACAELGVELGDGDLDDLTGLSLVRVDALLRERHDVRFTFDELRDTYRGRYLAELRRGVAACPGAIELLAALARERVPVAVASSSPRNQIELVLAATGADAYVQRIASGDEVAATKPAPDVYLLAVERLGGPDVRRSVAIEDSPAGVAAAVGAGLRCVGVRAASSRPPLDGAAVIVSSLEEVTPAGLGELAAAG
jgi:HAD superfamily hydrolase (TIGR01509 family)